MMDSWRKWRLTSGSLTIEIIMNIGGSGLNVDVIECHENIP